MRRFQSEQKAAALADWRRFAAHRPLIGQPVDDAKHDPPLTARQVEELLAAAHRYPVRTSATSTAVARKSLVGGGL